MKRKHSYLVHLQYLGFRYSGWQKQPGQRTIESMLHKTLKFIAPDKKFKIVGAGRTDAKVSALMGGMQLFTEYGPIEDIPKFIELFNENLPPDIKILSIEEVDPNFAIIQHKKSKEYCYFFSFGDKSHPFSAPFMANIQSDLNIEQMKEAAALFCGTHNFQSYTARRQPNTKVIRTITFCEIAVNTILQANFFPENTYVLTVRGEGFMRYQIRMIMGALILLGKGEITLQTIKGSLGDKETVLIPYVAPGSGLLLNKIEFK
ncbi:MAG: tRNA pseudouridine(38-40) synthase TruA [Eudoraea sp.]|nr:tRNA pseudouridine(38-40) synthase TruA [Eudoraea sp.]